MPRDFLVHRRHTLLQRPLSESRHTELIAPEQIRVGKVDRDLLFGGPLRCVFRIFDGAKDAAVGADEVQYELEIAPPVPVNAKTSQWIFFLAAAGNGKEAVADPGDSPGIVKDKDGSERDGGKVGLSDIGPFFFCHLVVRPHGGLPCEDVGGDIGLLEAVAVSCAMRVTNQRSDYEWGWTTRDRVWSK